MLMTVKEYAESIGKSIPLIYKQIAKGQLKAVKKFGVMLIKTKSK